MRRTFKYRYVEFEVTIGAAGNHVFSWRFELPWSVTGRSVKPVRGIEAAFREGERAARQAIADELDG